MIPWAWREFFSRPLFFGNQQKRIKFFDLKLFYNCADQSVNSAEKSHSFAASKLHTFGFNQYREKKLKIFVM